MPAPQSFVPRRPSRTKTVRRFTLAEANKTLPLVKRIVADIVKMHERAADLAEKSETLPPGEASAAEQALQRSREQMETLVSELSSVGAELKDSSTGLIDFVGRHDGRDVYLCWKLGEDAITHWHELDAGYAGRQPVAKLKEQ